MSGPRGTNLCWEIEQPKSQLGGSIEGFHLNGRWLPPPSREDESSHQGGLPGRDRPCAGWDLDEGGKVY